MIGIEAGPTSAEADVVRRERKSFKRNAHETLPKSGSAAGRDRGSARDQGRSG